MGGSALLALLHLCDSLFPIGAFAYSDGLESAVNARAVCDSDDLRRWLDVCLDEAIGRCDGPAVLIAWSAFREQDWESLIALDEELTAMRPSRTTRMASRSMGLRLMNTWHALHPDARLHHAPVRASASAWCRRARAHPAGGVCRRLRLRRWSASECREPGAGRSAGL